MPGFFVSFGMVQIAQCIVHIISVTFFDETAGSAKGLTLEVIKGDVTGMLGIMVWNFGLMLTVIPLLWLLYTLLQSIELCEETGRYAVVFTLVPVPDYDMTLSLSPQVRCAISLGIRASIAS